MRVAYLTTYFITLSLAAENHMQPFRDWDCVTPARGRVGTGDSGRCINFDNNAMAYSFVQEKKTRGLGGRDQYCYLWKTLDCKGKSEDYPNSIPLSTDAERHVCRNPSVNGFKSIKCHWDLT
jgi:hypothetical protein